MATSNQEDQSHSLSIMKDLQEKMETFSLSDSYAFDKVKCKNTTNTNESHKADEISNEIDHSRVSARKTAAPKAKYLKEMMLPPDSSDSRVRTFVQCNDSYIKEQQTKECLTRKSIQRYDNQDEWEPLAIRKNYYQKLPSKDSRAQIASQYLTSNGQNNEQPGDVQTIYPIEMMDFLLSVLSNDSCEHNTFEDRNHHQTQDDRFDNCFDSSDVAQAGKIPQTSWNEPVKLNNNLPKSLDPFDWKSSVTALVTDQSQTSSHSKLNQPKKLSDQVDNTSLKGFMNCFDTEKNIPEIEREKLKKSTKKRRRVRKGWPKQPLSGYNIFYREERVRILGFTQTQKKLGQYENEPDNLPSSSNKRSKIQNEKNHSYEQKNESNFFYLDKGNEKSQNEGFDLEKNEEKEVSTSTSIKRKRGRPRDMNSPNPRQRHGKIGFQELTKTIATRWKSLLPDVVNMYKERAKRDRERYDNEINSFIEKHGDSTDLV